MIDEAVCILVVLAVRPCEQSTCNDRVEGMQASHTSRNIGTSGRRHLQPKGRRRYGDPPGGAVDSVGSEHHDSV